MERTYISWTVENWITVVLMVAGFGIGVSLIYKGLTNFGTFTGAKSQ